jgi:hypothetical protein
MDEYDNEIATEDIEQIQQQLYKELVFLFGEETVEQARLIDVVDLQLNKDMTQCISKGVTRLKQLKDIPDAQQKFIQELKPAEQILVCMWIMEMNLIDKLQSNSYINTLT